jgi:phage gpG-like protein
MGVVVTDNSDAFLKRLEAAVDGPGGGLDVATQTLAAKMREIMPQGGDYGIANDTPTANIKASAPGSPPMVRSGQLRNSITNARVGALRWAAGTNVKYARIQEFGGTINHPGGTAYFIKDGKAVFVSEKAALQMSLNGQKLNKTNPHQITLPARPYMRPALRNNEAAIGRVFNARVRRIMEGGAA